MYRMLSAITLLAFDQLENLGLLLSNRDGICDLCLYTIAGLVRGETLIHRTRMDGPAKLLRLDLKMHSRMDCVLFSHSSIVLVLFYL